MHGEQEKTGMAEREEPLGQHVGEYRLLRQFGKGSFGAVYLAEHRHNHSQAAVKLLRFHLTSPEDFKEFLNEARTIRLRHKHIVPLLDFDLTRDNTPYLVMEYAEGGTLRQHCRRGTKLPFETLDSYVRDSSFINYPRQLVGKRISTNHLLKSGNRSNWVSKASMASSVSLTPVR